MLGFTIDGNDLWTTYGIKVVRVRGYLDFLKRKGETEYNWLDEDGVEAYTDAEDIYYEPRKITLQCVLIATSKALIFSQMNAFKLLMEASGTHTLAVPHTATTYTVYYKGGDNIEPPRNYKATLLYCKFSLTLWEETPARAT